MNKIVITIKENKKENNVNVNIERKGNDKTTQNELNAGVNIYNLIVEKLEEIG